MTFKHPVSRDTTSSETISSDAVASWNAFQTATGHILHPIETLEHYHRIAHFLDGLLDIVRPDYTAHALWPLVDYVTHLIGDYDAAHPLELASPQEMLSYYVEQSKLSQTALARAVELDQSLISKHLRGERDINLDHARAYSKFFMVPLEAFIR